MLRELIPKLTMDISTTTYIHGNLRVPLLCHPPQEIRPYQGSINHWFPLIRPKIRALFLGGVALGGGTLGSHEYTLGFRQGCRDLSGFVR